MNITVTLSRMSDRSSSNVSLVNPQYIDYFYGKTRIGKWIRKVWYVTTTIEKANSNYRLTFNKKHIDIQGTKEDRNTTQQQSTASTANNIIFQQNTKQTILDMEYRRTQISRYFNKWLLLLQSHNRTTKEK